MSIAEDLDRDGYAGPIRVFAPDECAMLVRSLSVESRTDMVWGKACATVGVGFHAAATRPQLLEPIVAALGDDVILWGASLVVKDDNEVHPFHTDVESMAPEGGFVTAWIGLENISRESGLKFVRGSHRYGETIQEANHRNGVRRADSVDEAALAAAREHDAGAEIVQPPVGVGEALLFDGRLWHGSRNDSGLRRTALLLQYARADRPVYMPTGFEWPITIRTDVRPPVIGVSGVVPLGVNRVAIAPSAGRRAANAAHQLPQRPTAMSLPFASMPHVNGPTPIIEEMESHTSLLAPGESPHPLHSHIEEEILVIMSGEAELRMADDADGKGLARRRASRGDFAYYPAYQFHTIVNTSAEPVLYTMFKWAPQLRQGDGRPTETPAFVQSSQPLAQTEQPDDMAVRVVFERRTRWLKRLQAHITVVAPGGGYDPHADAYDVAILLIEGKIETLGRTLSAPAVLFHPAGSLHGLRAAGPSPARYLVVEFDGARFWITRPLRRAARVVRGPLGRLRRWLATGLSRPADSR